MLTDEQRTLAADPDALRMAHNYAVRFARHYPLVDPDEFESAAMMGVVYAARTFDGRGRFSGFAVVKVVGWLRTVLRTAARRNDNIPTRSLANDSRADDGLDDDEGHHECLCDDHPPAGYFDEQHEEVEASIALLPWAAQRELVRDLFLRCRDHGMQKNVAERRGVSRNAVCMSLKRLGVRLRAIVTDRRVLVA